MRDRIVVGLGNDVRQNLVAGAAESSARICRAAARQTGDNHFAVDCPYCEEFGIQAAEVNRRDPSEEGGLQNQRRRCEAIRVKSLDCG